MGGSIDGTASAITALKGFNLLVGATNAPSGDGNINISVAKTEGSFGTVDFTTDGKGVKVTDLGENESGTLQFTFVDNVGIINTVSIAYKKAN